MTCYKNAIRDKRVREYLPVTRVLWSQNCDGAENMVGNQDIQPQVVCKTPSLQLHPGGGVLLDFGIELHGGIRIVNAFTEGKVRVRFGESASEAMQQPNQHHAIHDTVLDLPAMGMTEYGNTAFRFLRIDSASEAELEIRNVTAVALFNDLEYAEFCSSDERLNRIWRTGAYTLQLNMQDYIYDGAKRDRLVWMGDLNPEVRGILAAFPDSSLIPKSLDFVRDQTPLPAVMNNITSYSFWWVICIYDYFRHSGDRAWLEEQNTYLQGLLRQILTYVDANGVEQVPGRRFLDWPNNDNTVAMHAGLQGLLYWTLGCGAELGGILGFDTAQLQAARARMVKYIPDCGGSKAAAAVMTISGLADKSDVLLTNHLSDVSTFYGYYMLLAQPLPDALELIRKYWGAMLDYGATTFWEDFDLNWVRNTSSIAELPVPGKDDLHADFGNYCYKGLRHSLCHGWACGPTPYLSEKVLGVKILEPGCKTLEIKPQLLDLEYVRGTFPTPSGLVKIQAERGKKPEIHAPASINIVTE